MGIKFCAQQTIISKKKEKKERRGRIMRYENFDLDLGAHQHQGSHRRKRS
jgi:hypothetical protein